MFVHTCMVCCSEAAQAAAPAVCSSAPGCAWLGELCKVPMMTSGGEASPEQDRAFHPQLCKGLLLVNIDGAPSRDAYERSYHGIWI